MSWTAVLAASIGCYALKLAGLSVPRRLLDDDRVQRAAALIPVALLATLIVLQTFTDGQTIVLDARAAGLGVAIVAIRLRAPFLVVVAAAATTAALLRLVV
jgi:hypothetical protein